MATARRPLIRFGVFELDRAAGELFRSGRKVPLQEQPLQVLLALLERPGEVVTRDELRRRLWQHDTFVDFDHGLNTAIKKVRAALGDSADNPRFVETLARRGYRFIAPVTAIRGVDPDIAPASSAEAADKAPRPSRGWLAAATLALILAATIGFATLFRMSDIGAGSGLGNPVAPTRVAVLPLRVLPGADPPAQTEHLGVGIADAIITRLSYVPGIALYPTATVLRFADDTAELSAARTVLKAEHLLTGTVQPTQGAYRVSVQLVRASDGTVIWGRTYDMPRAALLQLQDSVAEQVVNVLAPGLTTVQREQLRRPFTTNAHAYDAYLRGRARMANYTEAKMREAIADYEEAVRLDPDYALARAALATSLAWFSVRYAYESEATAWARRAEDEAQAALARDSALGEAHLALANAAGTVFRGFDWPTVLREAEEALAIDPTLELAELARMRAFYHQGRFPEARAAAARARLLNPSPNVEIDRVAIAVELFEGNYTAARDQATTLLARNDAPAVRNYLGLARFYLGDIDGAREMLASAQRGGRPDIRSQAALASVSAAAGDRAEARRVLAGVLSSGYLDHHVAYSVAAAYAQLGEPARSVEWLDRAAATGFGCHTWFARDPLLNPVRQTEAFTTLVERLRGGQPARPLTER